MLRYKLNTLAERREGTVVQLPMVQATNAAEVAFLRALRRMLRQIGAAVNADIIPAVLREYARQQAQVRITGDVSSGDFDAVKNLSLALARGVARTVESILSLEAQRHTKSFMANAKRALGIDLSAVVRNEDLGDYMQTASTRAAGLITNLAEDMVHRIQQTVTTAVTTGQPVKELKRQLVEQYGIADRRAQLIARDQTAKFNSDLNRIRHEQAGIEQYVWRTSHDERVRSRHRALDGKIYAYGERTGAENGLPPGQPIRCRCIAQAIVKF